MTHSSLLKAEPVGLSGT